ncbi:MAG: VOC family protein, partial [Dehalococcoidales bacterium]|nr:VOC family protein [Dehalococcoidales bacterium]
KTVPEKEPGSYPIPVKTWSHIAVSVTDMERAVKWYGSVLGFTLSHTDEIATPAGKFKVTWLKAPNFCLEIFETPGAKPVPPERLNPATDLKTPGNKYLTLGVTDINKTTAELKKLDVKIISRGNKSLFIRDKDGILIELAESAA